MTIHKEGYTSIALTILFIFVLNALVKFFLPDTTWAHWAAYIFSFLLFVIILQFFAVLTLKLPSIIHMSSARLTERWW